VKYPHLLGALMDAVNNAIDVGLIAVQEMAKFFAFRRDCGTVGGLSRL
jgi:hypothetical protein